MKVVMAFGTFDLLHPGHLYYLKQAKRFGDKLIVVVARDSTVHKVKKRFPKYDELERLEYIRELPYVDKAVLGYEEDKYEIIEEINPDIVVLGYDQDAFTKNLQEELKRRGCKAKVIRVGAYKADRYKSSKLKELKENI